MSAPVVDEPAEEVARRAIPGSARVPRYPETRIGAFGFSVATCTEPLSYGSADGQRACGDSWSGIAEDLFLFTQEDPIMAPGSSLFSYVGSAPLRFIDPLGLWIVDRSGIREFFHKTVADFYGPGGCQSGAGGACTRPRAALTCSCACSGGFVFANCDLELKGEVHVFDGDFKKNNIPEARYDKTVTDTMSALRHEWNAHILPASRDSSLAKIIDALEARPFGSAWECEDAWLRAIGPVAKAFLDAKDRTMAAEQAGHPIR